MSIKKLIVKKCFTDSEMEQKEGDYFGENFYKTIIKENIDVYKEDGELLFKLRKNVIPEHFFNIISDSFRNVSQKKHDNRGASAGILNWEKMPNYVGDWINSKKFRTHYTQKKKGKISKHYISNLSPSNILGYFEKKDRNKPESSPCRLTAFSLKESDKWKATIPFFQYIDSLFKQYVPDRYEKQLIRAKISDNYRIKNTCFSTITVNYSWRTACHKDKGDYEEGFGNLIVCNDYKNPNSFEGCYLGFPQYGICVEAKQGDFLAMNVHEWHCNTEFKPKLEKYVELDPFKDIDYKNNWHLNRISIVCYLRKNMIKCIN